MGVSGQDIANKAARLFGSTSTTEDAYVLDALIQNAPGFSIQVTDGGTAGSAVGEQIVGYAPYACQVVLCELGPGVTAAADNTDYVTFTLAKRTAGGSATTVATGDTRAASLNGVTAFTPVALPLSSTSGAVALAAGDAITFKIVKSGAGKAIGAAATASGASLNVFVQVKRLYTTT